MSFYAKEFVEEFIEVRDCDPTVKELFELYVEVANKAYCKGLKDAETKLNERMLAV